MAMSGPSYPSDPTATPRTEMECRQIAELLGDYLEGALPKRTAELL